MTPDKLTPKQKVLVLLPKIEEYAAIACTDTEIARIVGVSEATLQRYAAEALSRARAALRAQLRSMQLKRCSAGSDKMLIWLGQQMLNQRRESRDELVVQAPLYPTQPEVEVPENVNLDATDSRTANG